MPVTLHGVAYSTVNERLNVAHGESIRPKGIRSIVTEYREAGKYLIAHAVVTFEDGRAFHGSAEVTADSTNAAERDNPTETAETSAIGRALAMAGYFGSEKGLAGAEEMRTAQRRTAARETPAAVAPQARADTPAAWFHAALKVARERGIEVEDLPERLAPDAPDDYAKEMCRRLKARIDAAK